MCIQYFTCDQIPDKCLKLAKPLFIAAMMWAGLCIQAQPLQRVSGFGSNPGGLTMHFYTPPGSDANTKMPLVVVLHGCLQSANIIARQTGWNQLADRYGFRVLYPQQRFVNNPMGCFCWYRKNDIEKGKGEDLSIKEMIDETERNYNTDSGKVFITGLSAGALMAVSMMADYPELFNAGAIFAGAPYKTATNLWSAMLTAYGWNYKSPDNWARLVRDQNPLYKGSYPRMIIYQGRMDIVVNQNNSRQLVKQWTALHHISPRPAETIRHFARARAVDRRTYVDSNGRDAVIYYRLKGVGHALPIDPGDCGQQGGKMTAFSRDINYYSTYWVAVDFGLIPKPTIAGRDFVDGGEMGLTFSVPPAPGAKYRWHLPKHCTIMGDKNSNSITVNWGPKSGNVDVTETGPDKCKFVYSTLFVRVSTAADYMNPQKP
jgi:poly(hydroxyalkanoate) depolymerase family esterase